MLAGQDVHTYRRARKGTGRLFGSASQNAKRNQSEDSVKQEVVTRGQKHPLSWDRNDNWTVTAMPALLTAQNSSPSAPDYLFYYFFILFCLYFTENIVLQGYGSGVPLKKTVLIYPAMKSTPGIV